MTRGLVEVATVGRVHGLRGELHVRPINPETELLTPGRCFRATTKDGSERELVIELARETGQGWLVKFVGVDQREVAAALTNSKLLIRREDMPEPEADSEDEESFYQSDLVGLQVRDQNGRELGRLEGFFFNGAHDVCVVRTEAGREVLTPFLDDTLLEVDLEARWLVLTVPEGLPGLDDGEGE